MSSSEVGALHWTYSRPDSATLCQGDIVQRSGEVLDVLREVHPYFAEQDKYLYFMLVTQSCDLVRRDGDRCNAPYLTIAAVREFTEVVLTKEMPRVAGSNAVGLTVSDGCRGRIQMFLERLLNNNDPNYFFLRADQSQGVGVDCCVCLRVSVPLRVEHYDKLLRAKSGQLSNVFQAKLGWLVGNNYSRVGTPDWTESKERRDGFNRLTRTLVDKLKFMPARQFKRSKEVLRARGLEVTEDAMEGLRRDPDTQVLKRRELFKRAFDEVWPEGHDVPGRESLKKAIVTRAFEAWMELVITDVWPAGSTSSDRDTAVTSLRDTDRLIRLLDGVFDDIWPVDRTPPTRGKLLGRIQQHGDFLSAVKEA